MSALLASPPIKRLETQPTLSLPADCLYRLSVEQYHAMIDAGVIGEDDPVELLDGLLVQSMGKRGPPCVCLALLRDLLPAMLPSGWSLRIQDPLTLEGSEPEPDAVIVRGDVREFLAGHPTAAEAQLVIEVADSSLTLDRGVKRQIYAANEVPVYWIVNLLDRVVEVYTQPDRQRSDYTHCEVYSPAQSVPVPLAGTFQGEIPVAEFLP